MSSLVEDDARQRLRAERDAIESARTRQFLIAQSTILGIAVLMVTVSNLTGLMSALVFTQSIVFCAVVGLLTAVGWVAFARALAYRPLVLGLLYVDSLLGLVFFYAAGEFETPALIILTTCVIMAPIFVGRRAAWGVAVAQVLGYGFLLAARQYGWLPFLDYGYMLPREAVTEPGFVIDSLSNFTIATLAVAYLAGQASLDILNSQDQLEREVASKTRELARARDSLEAANADLAGANLALNDANHRLERANDQLRISHGRLEQFNTAAGHDLKAPLQTLMGRAELIALAGAQNPERAARIANDIVDTAERMSRQIDELLKLSQVGDRLGEREPVSIAEVVSQASHDVSDRMRAAGAQLEIVHPLPIVRGNGPLLKELFQNLFENSVKYGNAGGARIRVSADPAAEGRVVVIVADDGPGVPEDRRESVFSLFKRLPGHAKHEGVGAGLAIVRRIVEVHGGSVHIEDGRELPGARFVVELQESRRNRPSANDATTIH